MIKIDVVGKKLRPFLKNLQEKQLTLLSNDIFRGVQNLTPVKSGKAKRSWFMRRKRNGKIIQNNTPYIAVLDEGRSFRAGQMRGSKQAPRGMTKPTFDKLKARNKIK